MKEYLAALFIVFCLFSSAQADDIYLDQLGYLTDSPKTAIVEGTPKEFKITDLNGTTMLTGNKTAAIFDPETGKTVARIDFSKLAAPGEYYLHFGQTRRDLMIGENPYREVRSATLRSFYLQRCGQAIDDRTTGLKYPACHTHDAQYLPSTGKSGQKVVSGGWHDAGDYGKYVPPANYAASTLLFSCHFNKTLAPAILKELRYELDWLLKMQEIKTGGVYHKATRKDFEPFILPDRDKERRYLSRISSAATAGFAGTLAQAAQAFKKSDPKYSAKLVKAAQRAWQFLEKEPGIVPPGGFDNDPEIKTGAYGDTNDGDERLFAAVALLGATGSRKYQDYFIRNYRRYDPGDTSRLGWQDLRHHAYIAYLLLPEQRTMPEVRTEVKQRFISFAEKLVQQAKTNGFGVVMKSDDYRWGSNGLLMDYAKALLFAQLFTGESKYRDLAQEQLHYVLGRNGHDLCYITGFGEKTVTHLHHRPSIASGRELPGFLAGGPNKYLQDGLIKSVFTPKTPPALVYLDEKDSYSTNENAIYWNASLLLVLSAFGH